MKNLFEKPYIDVIKFSVLDVLTNSPTGSENETTDDNESGYEGTLE